MGQGGTVMTLSKCITILSVSASLALALSAGSVAAQGAPPYLSYAAKFACGTALLDADVVKGVYATSVNIHNPQNVTPVNFLKKFVVALQEGQSFQQPIVLNSNEVLGPDLAERVDCPLIASHITPKPDLTKVHIEGFVVIEVPQTSTSGTTLVLDVVAKYSARGAATGFTVVKIPPTLIGAGL
jgi:hypothetical protein